MTKLIERNTTIPAQKSGDLLDRRGQPDRGRHRRPPGRARDGRATTGSSANSGSKGIRPAPRGEPQVEVTFDIDANGILNVSARDKDTGAEQQVTITETTNLDSSEIERMVKEAEEHAAEDRVRREEVDARNELDAFAHRVERQLEELGDRVPVNQREQAEALVRDARGAIDQRGRPRPGAATDLRPAADGPGAAERRRGGRPRGRR